MSALNSLKDLCHRDHAVLTGNGTTALVLSLWALGVQGKRVAIPNSICYSVPLAVYLSGNEPVWLDVAITTMGLSAEWLKKQRDRYDAVIAVHNYGIPCDIEAIAEFCWKKSIPLIEDCAVALGATVDGCPVGPFGDLSVLSFGTGKIIDYGHGGAVLSDDKALADDVETLRHLFPPRLSQEARRVIKSTSHLHTKLYNHHYEKVWKKLSIFGQYARLYWGYIVAASFDSVGLEGMIRDLPNNIASRAKKAERFRELLKSCHKVGLCDPPQGSVYWRFNLLVSPRLQQSLLRHLHAKGYKASSWHAPSDIFWRERSRADTSITPNADYLGDSIINLWVDHTVDDGYITSVSKEIREFMESNG